MVRALAFAMFVATSSCAPQRIAAPKPAPVLDGPRDVIPADLDLVVRLDLARMRAALGQGVTAELASKARLSNERGSDRGTELLLTDALAKADTVWLAVRPGLSPEQTDNVLVLRGAFAGMELRRAGSEPAWEAARDLGGDLRRYDRAKPKLRAAPSRIYVRGERILVFVSEAEIDSVERTLENGRGEPALEPPEKGALSFAVRLPALVEKIEKRAPTIVKLLYGAERAEASADLTNDGLHAELAVDFADPERAERVGATVRELAELGKRVQGRLGRVAEGLRVDNAGDFVSLDLSLSPADFAQLLDCGRSDCAW